MYVDPYDIEVKNETTRELSELLLLVQRKKKQEVTRSCIFGSLIGVFLAALYFIFFATSDNLVIALQKGMIRDAENLLLDGHDPNQKDGRGNPVLHYLCSEDLPLFGKYFLNIRDDILDLLVEHGVDLEAKDKKGESVGHLCAHISDFHMLNKLVKYGLSVGSLNGQGKNIINILIEKHQHDFNQNFIYQMRELFATANPTPDDVNNGNMLVSLYNITSVIVGQVLKVADLLLEYGANPNVVVHQYDRLSLYLIYDVLESYCNIQTTRTTAWLLYLIQEHGPAALNNNTKRVPLIIPRNALMVVCDVHILQQLVEIGAPLHNKNLQLTLMDEHMETFYRTQQMIATQHNEDNSPLYQARLEQEVKILEYLFEQGVFMTGSTILVQGPPDLNDTIYMMWGKIITEALVGCVRKELFLPQFFVLPYGDTLEAFTSEKDKPERVYLLHTKFPPVASGVIEIHITCHGAFKYYWGKELPCTWTEEKSYDHAIQTKVEQVVDTPFYLILWGNNKRCTIKTTID
eukprot:TRINITY_DN2245_c0_g1_i1.p1 TRINITY_DN2245_c0_g1~~TRINITY_DN2245_c0_g1_i1.p1  ORF type:complete len:529 (+),score=102.94 TRINITY_DN2245_c0_g1_i1:36-1589(+)